MGRRRVYSKINTLTHSKVMEQHNKKVVVFGESDDGGV